MIRRRNGKLSADVVPMVIVDGVFILSIDDLFLDMLIKLDGPGIAAVHLPVDPGKIVNDVSASQYHDSLLPQRRQLLTDAVMGGGGIQRIDAKLEYGNICVRVHMLEYRPCAMVDPPGIIDPDGFFLSGRRPVLPLPGSLSPGISPDIAYRENRKHRKPFLAQEYP